MSSSGFGLLAVEPTCLEPGPPSPLWAPFFSLFGAALGFLIVIHPIKVVIVAFELPHICVRGLDLTKRNTECQIFIFGL